jgi:hypothetical protein|nr:MAG TPA: hypothetical protein [Bacteriophage sp.]
MFKKLLVIPSALWEQRRFLLTFCIVQVVMFKFLKWIGW